MTTPSEAAQIAALRRVAYAREYPNEPANCDQQAVLDACDLAERLLRERDQWKMFHDSLTESGAVVVNELQRETGRANRAERERDAARTEYGEYRQKFISGTTAQWEVTSQELIKRAEAAEARVRALEAALKRAVEILKEWRDRPWPDEPGHTNPIDRRSHTDLFLEFDAKPILGAQRVLDGGGER